MAKKVATKKAAPKKTRISKAAEAAMDKKQGVK